MFAIASTPEHMVRVIDLSMLPTREMKCNSAHKSSLRLSFIKAAVQRAMINVRYCFYPRTNGQGDRSKLATTSHKAP